MIMNIQTTSDQRMRDLERRSRVAESLRGILAVLNSNLPLEDILAHIVEQAGPLLEADGVAIYRLQKNGMLTIQSSAGLGPEYISLASVPLGILATGQAALKLQPTHIPDVLQVRSHTDPQDVEMLQLLEQLAVHYRSILSIPMVIRGETYGTLTLYYCQPSVVTPEQIDLAISFCNQAALAVENASLRSQIEKEAVAAERARLARDLHDSVTQMLFSANLIAEVLPTLWERSTETGRQGLEELHQLTRGALAEMRTLLLELRPSALENASLEELLRQLAESTSARMRIPVDFQFSGGAPLSRDVRIVYYRIAQEALNNIVKHASASRVSLSLSCTPPDSPVVSRRVEMSIVDDGCGFDPRQAGLDHLGMGIMKERAESVGAQLTVSSQKKCGTTINVVWNFIEVPEK